MKPLLLALLALSIAANAWEFRRRSTAASAPAKRVRSTATAGRDLALAADPKVAKLSGAELTTSDLALLRDSLRAGGVDDEATRAIIDGALRTRFRNLQSELRVRQLTDAWWRPAVPGTAPTLRKFVTEPLNELMGKDPRDTADAELRYDFLPAETRRKLAAIDIDYNELQARATEAGNAAVRGEIEAQQLLARERRNDVLAAMTPEEREEYDLRFSAAAAENARRFSAIQATEAEYRAIEPIMEDYRANGAKTPGFGQLQPALDQLVAALGYDRALDYAWAMHTSTLYGNAADLLARENLSPHAAAEYVQVAAETGQKAALVHRDSSLDEAQKRSALLQLQKAAQEKIDSIIPSSLQARMPRDSTEWLTLLGDGRYKPVLPSLTGTGVTVPTVESVALPPKFNLPSVPIPRRPAGR